MVASANRTCFHSSLVRLVDNLKLQTALTLWTLQGSTLLYYLTGNKSFQPKDLVALC